MPSVKPAIIPICIALNWNSEVDVGIGNKVFAKTNMGRIIKLIKSWSICSNLAADAMGKHQAMATPAMVPCMPE